MPIRISKDRINMDDKRLEQPVLKDYGETVVTANSGSSYASDCSKYNASFSSMTNTTTLTAQRSYNGQTHTVSWTLVDTSGWTFTA